MYCFFSGTFCAPPLAGKRHAKASAINGAINKIAQRRIMVLLQ
jgi:hypothetical protein